MLGQTYFHGSINLNTMFNDIDIPLGLEFENYIFNVLSKELKNYYEQGTKIFSTSSSRDHGKDIIIESTVTLNIFGQKFICPANKKIKIYIECKSSASQKIRYNEFAGNLERIKADNIQYYVLITNTTIVPFSYYSFSESLKMENIEFVLIDQYLLFTHLLESGEVFDKITDLENYNDIYIEYQPNSCLNEMQPLYELFLWIRNYSSEPRHISLFLETDRNWEISQNNIDKFVDAKKAECLKLIIKKQYFDGIDDLHLHLSYNNKSTSIQVKGIDASFNFIPPLVGEKHKDIIKKLTSQIYNSEVNNIHFLLGEAGVGKTRILDEVTSALLGKNYNICRIICEKNKSTLKIICDALKNQNKKISTCKSFLECMELLDVKYRKQVIIIDDLHNAEAPFYHDIREMLKSTLKAGISIIFVGRNDYSAGDTEFFSLLQYCKETYKDRIYSITSLEDDEAKALIKAVIKGIPQVAIDKIYSLSNNNPLFIIQTIEYMLDIKIVSLLNRTTVGIDNPESFSAHLYIPQSIEEIYTQRMHFLMQLDQGESLLCFLYIAASVGVSIPDYLAEIFFEGREELLNILINRRYIAKGEKGYIFAHESLYLYMHKLLLTDENAKIKAGRWLTSIPIVCEQLDPLKKGQLFLWSEDAEEAKKYFFDAITSIQKIINYSSVNIDRNYYDYMEEIYLICDSYEAKKQVVVGKIYIALHYHTPYEAIYACEWGEIHLKHFPQFKKDTSFQFYLTEQMAHSYLNAGQVQKCELLLNELLSKYMLGKENCDAKAVFDMYDKFSSMYIKYNCFSVAENYCKLSLNHAKELDDTNLEALSYISSAKLYLYTNKKKAKKYLLKAHSLLSEDKAHRIKCHNDVSLLIMKLLEAPELSGALIEGLKDDAAALLKVCVDNSFTNSIIRLYVLLASIYYLLGMENKDFEMATLFAEKGIDASITFGISTYIWQCYNLLALIAIQCEKEIQEQAGLFDTVYNILRKQNLTYIGKGDFTYGNILALSNIASFYQRHSFESVFNKKLGQITFWDNISSCDFECSKSICQYQCNSSLELISKEWKKINMKKQKQYFIFGIKAEPYILQDSNGYYIILS